MVVRKGLQEDDDEVGAASMPPKHFSHDAETAYPARSIALHPSDHQSRMSQDRREFFSPYDGSAMETSEIDWEDGATLISDLTGDIQVVEAITRADLAKQIREQLRLEMEQELAVDAVTAEVIQENESGFWTRKRLVVATSLISLVLVGIVVGIVVATGVPSPENDTLKGITITGMNGEDRFGDSIALSRDGSTLASVAMAGHYVQVFRRGNATAWNPVGNPLHFSYDIDHMLQGRIDLSGDGSILAVGRWNDNEASHDTGSAKIFWYNAKAWKQLGQNLTGSSPTEHFGHSIALSDDGLTVGVGSHIGDPSTDPVDEGYVRVFSYNGTLPHLPGQWRQLGSDLKGKETIEQLGVSLALAANGRRIAVGALGGTARKGIARVYDYSNNREWNQVGEQLVGDYDKDVADEVKMTADGKILVIAAGGSEGIPNFAGYKRTYKLEGCCVWKHVGQDLIGSSRIISLSSDGTCLAVGLPDSENEQGRGELYRWSDSELQWQRIAVAKGDNPGDRLGNSVAVSGNCSLFVLGAPQKDSAERQPGYVRVYQVTNESFAD